MSDPTPVRLRKGSSGFEEQTRAYLQERLRLFCFVGFVLLGLIYVGMRILESQYAEDARQTFSTAQAIIHLSATVSAAALWVVLRGRDLGRRVLLGMDVAAITVYAAASILILAFGDETDIGVVAFVLGLFLLSRAVLVPSTARRTLAISIVAVAVFLAVPLLAGRVHNLQGPYVSALMIPVVAIHAMILGAAVALAVTASRVTFRLRRDAYEKAQLGPYVLEEKIGEGGMGEVHRARHRLLRRPTAVKLVRAHLDGEALQRFEREVWMTSRLTHPNTVGVYDYGHTPDGVFYYAMELLEGADLRDVLQADAPLPAARVIHILEQVSGALAEAHSRGLVHRDVKPGNLFLCDRGGISDVVKVMDFGLVQTHDADTKLTMVGAVVGTPQYMSPEAFSGDDVGPRADLYSLGATAYELLTGKVVFDASGVGDLVVQHIQEKPKAPSEHTPGIPKDLERIVLRCLEKDPDDRPENAAGLREELLACADAGRWSQDDARGWWQDHLPDRIRKPDRESS